MLGHSVGLLEFWREPIPRVYALLQPRFLVTWKATSFE